MSSSELSPGAKLAMDSLADLILVRVVPVGGANHRYKQDSHLLTVDRNSTIGDLKEQFLASIAPFLNCDADGTLAAKDDDEYNHIQSPKRRRITYQGIFKLSQLALACKGKHLRDNFMTLRSAGIESLSEVRYWITGPYRHLFPSDLNRATDRQDAFNYVLDAAEQLVLSSCRGIRPDEKSALRFAHLKETLLGEILRAYPHQWPSSDQTGFDITVLNPNSGESYDLRFLYLGEGLHCCYGRIQELVEAILFRDDMVNFQCTMKHVGSGYEVTPEAVEGILEANDRFASETVIGSMIVSEHVRSVINYLENANFNELDLICQIVKSVLFSNGFLKDSKDYHVMAAEIGAYSMKRGGHLFVFDINWMRRLGPLKPFPRFAHGRIPEASNERKRKFREVE